VHRLTSARSLSPSFTSRDPSRGSDAPPPQLATAVSAKKDDAPSAKPGTQREQRSRLPARAARSPPPVRAPRVRRVMHRTRQRLWGPRRQQRGHRRVRHRQVPQPPPRQTRTNRRRRTSSRSRQRPPAMTCWAAGPRLRRCGELASSCRARCWHCQPLIRSCWSALGVDSRVSRPIQTRLACRRAANPVGLRLHRGQFL
jgi:hypothetical protein